MKEPSSSELLTSTCLEGERRASRGDTDCVLRNVNLTLCFKLNQQTSSFVIGSGKLLKQHKLKSEKAGLLWCVEDIVRGLETSSVSASFALLQCDEITNTTADDHIALVSKPVLSYFGQTNMRTLFIENS